MTYRATVVYSSRCWSCIERKWKYRIPPIIQTDLQLNCTVSVRIFRSGMAQHDRTTVRSNPYETLTYTVRTYLILYSTVRSLYILWSHTCRLRGEDGVGYHSAHSTVQCTALLIDCCLRGPELTQNLAQAAAVIAIMYVHVQLRISTNTRPRKFPTRVVTLCLVKVITPRDFAHTPAAIYIPPCCPGTPAYVMLTDDRTGNLS